MSAGDFKPGTVVSCYVSTRDRRHVAVRVEDDGYEWRLLDGWDADLDLIGDSVVSDVRRLVILELPDGALAGWPTLVHHLEIAKEKTGLHMVFGGLIRQINAQTREPKPEEPTDPKACVADRRENIWRRLADGDWVCTSGPDVGEYLTWSQLTERGPLIIDGGAA